MLIRRKISLLLLFCLLLPAFGDTELAFDWAFCYRSRDGNTDSVDFSLAGIELPPPGVIKLLFRPYDATLVYLFYSETDDPKNRFYPDTQP